MVFLIPIGLIIFLIIFINHKNKKCEEYVATTSRAILDLKKINNEFVFYEPKNFNMTHSYDCEAYYRNVSCSDYLMYNLQYNHKLVLLEINHMRENESNFEYYIEKVKSIKSFDRFDEPYKFKHEKMIKYERKIFDSLIKHPPMTFRINVTLYNTNMNGGIKSRKTANYNENEIISFINKINNKNGNFFLDESTWKAIERVERAKVSNKMRFSIYERDNYRCRICHRRFDASGLEIDHIYPISKGGKTTYDNLQTLCIRCNKEKSNKINY